MASYADDLRDKQKIRDQLGKEDTTYTIIDQFSEGYLFQELSTKITSIGIGTGFVLGHITHSILGTTGFGLGKDLNPQQIVERVVNPFNRFIDYLRGTAFINDDNTNATIDINEYKIIF